MLRTIIWYVSFWLLQLLSTLCLVLYFLLGLSGRQALQDKFLYRTAQTWARLLIGLAGARVEVSGLANLPSGGGALFVANHQGAFDIPLLLGYIPGLKGFIAKREVTRLPIVGIWIKLLRCIILDRKDLRQSARAIALGVSDLRAGRSLVVFPEGTRSKSG
ncbi:MAG: 1-acyl-sn-glycerol-3-phosphate acyltransferase, partial [Candidatus Aminicenantes bacterium]|nr:1-acyl-sn-glycerol-3-phosphate acyltransferase [Candidatus Aminicenantes bacterium]